MLALTGFLTIVTVLLAIVSKRLSPLVALVAIPVAGALIAGEGMAVPGYMVLGITAIAPVAVMFMFAILFFGIMNDNHVFTPFINGVLKVCGSDPRKLFTGVVLITALVHLDGSGASTFLIVIPAVLPVFDALNIDRRKLAALVAMSAGVNNMLPWGGPTIRAAAALDVPVMELYAPVLPVHLSGFAFVLLIAYWMGHQERLKQNAISGTSITSAQQTRRADVKWFINIALIVIVISAIVASLLPPVVAFTGGALAALLINAPSQEAQKKTIDNHAAPVFMMVSILFAAGCFTGVLKHSGMLDAMASSGSTLLPEALTGNMPLVVAVLSMPLSLLFDPDSFYFGIMPVLAGIAAESGLPAVSVAHGALLGQMTTGFPVSPLTPATFLLIGLTQISLADHQRYALPLLAGVSLFMTLVAVLLGVIPL